LKIQIQKNNLEKHPKIIEVISLSIAALSSNHELSEKINHFSAILGRAKKADRAYIFKNSKNSENNNDLQFTHEWCAANITSNINQGLIDCLFHSDFSMIHARNTNFLGNITGFIALTKK
jgi:hypothetical protein